MIPYPNAVTAAGGSGLGVTIVGILEALGVDLPPVVYALIPAVLAPALVFVGHRGIVGAFRVLLYGSDPEKKP